jgi:hypothetical protein
MAPSNRGDERLHSLEWKERVLIDDGVPGMSGCGRSRTRAPDAKYAEMCATEPVVGAPQASLSRSR